MLEVGDTVMALSRCLGGRFQCQPIIDQINNWSH